MSIVYRARGFGARARAEIQWAYLKAAFRSHNFEVVPLWRVRIYGDHGNLVNTVENTVRYSQTGFERGRPGDTHGIVTFPGGDDGISESKTQVWDQVGWAVERLF